RGREQGAQNAADLVEIGRLATGLAGAYAGHPVEQVTVEERGEVPGPALRVRDPDGLQGLAHHDPDHQRSAVRSSRRQVRRVTGAAARATGSRRSCPIRRTTRSMPTPRTRSWRSGRTPAPTVWTFSKKSDIVGRHDGRLRGRGLRVR